jgi:glycosyltransferase involved in cell wall biosynthesis
VRRKILHVIGAMNRGGVETWLMHVARNIDKSVFELHFLTHTNGESAYDAEIRALGGHVHTGADPRNPLRYASDFAELVTKHGPFDAIHSHVYWYSGYVLRLAHKAGIPIRIAHSHTATNGSLGKPHRKAYEILMRHWILRHSTHRIGISRQAGEALFGLGRFTLLYYGLDFRRFSQAQLRSDAKIHLGISPGRKVIGHVGRFVPVKNHAFAVEVLERAIANGEDAHLLFVGDGPLMQSIRLMVESRGLSDRCTFAGTQSDVVPFLSAMDVFVLPSRWEGLGIAALEAQAAGVPVIASTSVPEEVDVIPELVERLSLSAGTVVWAKAVNRKFHDPGPRLGNEALLLQNSRFGLQNCLKALSSIYLGNAN